MVDGSITFETRLDNRDLEKGIREAERKIRKLESDVEKTEAARSPVTAELREAQEAAVQTLNTIEKLKAELTENQRFIDAGPPIDQYDAALERQKEIKAELTEQEKLLRWQEQTAERLERRDSALVQRLEQQTAELQRQREVSLDLQRQMARASSMEPLYKSMDRMETRLSRFTSRISRTLSRVFMFSLFYTGLRKVREYLWQVIQQNDQAVAAIARLKGALLTLAQPILTVAVPAFTALVNVIAAAVEALANLVSLVFGTTASQSAKAAKTLHDQAGGLNEVKDAAEEAAGSLAAFDEINTIETEKKSSSASGAGGGGGIEPDFSAFDTDRIKSRMEELTVYMAGALLALGALLFFSGVNIPLGLALMALGATALAKEAIVNWNNGNPEVQNAINRVLTLVGITFLVIGAILLFSGVAPLRGIALMALGAAALVAEANMNWNKMPDELRNAIAGALAVVGIVAVVIGAILAFTGVNIPLGVALMAFGVTALVSAAALDWGGGGLSAELMQAIQCLLMLTGFVAVSVGLFLLICGGPAAWPYGLALVLLGIAAVTAAVALDWDKLGNTMQEKLGNLLKIVGGMVALIGVILLFTGHIPLGIALLVAGIALFAAGVGTANWDALGNKISEKLAALAVMVGGFLALLGIILILTGTFPLGISLLIAGIALFGVGAANVNWDMLSEFVQSHLLEILTIVGGFLAILGVIIMLACPPSFPIGLGLLIAGIAIFGASQITANWDWIKPKLLTAWNVIKAVVGGFLAILGIVLLFACPALAPLALGLIKKGDSILSTSAVAPQWEWLKTKLAGLWNEIKNWYNTSVKKYLSMDYWKNKAAEMISGLVNGINENLRKAGSFISNLFSGKASATVTVREESVSRGGTLSSGGSFNASNGSASLTRSTAYPRISMSEVPALARGAVIPPNREFLAVLGDQKHGRNLEAPEGLFRQIVSEGNVEIVALLTLIADLLRQGQTIRVGEAVLGKTVQRALNNITASTGNFALDF